MRFLVAIALYWFLGIYVSLGFLAFMFYTDNLGNENKGVN